MRKELSYLALGLTPLLLITLAQGPLLRYQTSFGAAKQEYLDALQNNRRELADLSHQLRGVPALSETVQSLSGANRILNGYITPGKVDHIGIYDQNCNLMASSELGMPLNTACPVASANAVNKPYFQWRQAAHSKNYELAAPFQAIGDQSYFILASTQLNDQWLFHYPDLKKSMDSLQLHLGAPDKGVVIYQEPSNVTGRALATLSSTHPLLKVFPSLLESKPLNFYIPMAAALAFFLFTVVVIGKSLDRRRREVVQAIDKLYAFADELVPEGEVREAMTLEHKGGINILGLQERMSRLVKNSNERFDKVEHEKRVQQQQNVRLESLYLEQQAEQAWMIKARSMHQQMQSSAQTYLQKLSDTQSLGDDLSHLAAHEIVRPARQLRDLMMRWETELQLVSSRKFVRSLSERVDHEGRSELDDSLEFLLKSGEQLNNAAINITLLTQKLLTELGENTKLAQHWFEMMGVDGSKERSLLAMLKDGQSLIELQDKSVRYDNQIAGELSMEHLRIPASTLTSTLFHCQMALVENAHDSEATQIAVNNQLRVRDGRVVLVSTLKADIKDEFLLQKEFSPKAEQHFTMALQLVQGHPLRLTKLPSINGVHAIAMMWESAPETNLAPEAPEPRRAEREPPRPTLEL